MQKEATCVHALSIEWVRGKASSNTSINTSSSGVKVHVKPIPRLSVVNKTGLDNHIMYGFATERSLGHQGDEHPPL